VEVSRSCLLHWHWHSSPCAHLVETARLDSVEIAAVVVVVMVVDVMTHEALTDLVMVHAQ